MSRRARSKITIKRSTQRELKHMTRMKGKHGVKVGLPKGSGKYPDGTDVWLVGLWNEFGTVHAPERSWMRASIRKHTRDYMKLNRRSLLQIQQKRMSVARALGILGLKAKDDMVAEIDGFTTPANAPSTIARKGSNHPLIDTGVMKQSLTWEVVSR